MSGGDKTPKTPDGIDIRVGSLLRTIRQNRRMSQTALAEAVGVTFQQIQKYEKGTNRIGASRLQRVSEALDVPVTSFFEASNGAGPTLSAIDLDEYVHVADPVLRKHIRALVVSIEGRKSVDTVPMKPDRVTGNE